jgi:hypothetical protein
MHGLTVGAFIDMDENKQGSEIKGVPVKSLDEGSRDLDRIIVSNSAFYDDVAALLKGKYDHIELIDLQLQ